MDSTMEPTVDSPVEPGTGSDRELISGSVYVSIPESRSGLISPHSYLDPNLKKSTLESDYNPLHESGSETISETVSGSTLQFSYEAAPESVYEAAPESVYEP